MSERNRTKAPVRASRLRRRKPKHRIWPVGVGVVIVALALSLLLFVSPFFRIQEVRIEGNTLVPEEEIVEALGAVDTNLFLFPNDRARERLVTLDGIANVTFGRELPSRLVVRIEESYILAQVEANGQTLYVDEKGIVRDVYRAESNRLRPLVLELEVSVPPVGEALFSDERPVDFLRELALSPLAENVQKVQIDAAQNIDFMYNTLIIRFGLPNDIHRKLADALAVIKEITSKGIRAEEILLDAGENPIVVTDDATSEQPSSSTLPTEEETEGEP